VDFEERSRLLAKVNAGAAPLELLRQWQDGAIKLLLTARILGLRAEVPELFEQGEYEALAAAGPKTDCVCAFARHHAEASCLVLTARFPARLEADGGWSGTTIAAPRQAGTRPLRNLLSGDELEIREGLLDAGAAFGGLPVAIFATERAARS
jgi:(1->4)-alpha-D-glucan 1-alpha-D-glucosylmutase